MKQIDKFAYDFADHITQVTYDNEVMATHAFKAGFQKALDLIVKEFDLFRPDVQIVASKEIDK